MIEAGSTCHAINIAFEEFNASIAMDTSYDAPEQVETQDKGKGKEREREPQPEAGLPDAGSSGKPVKDDPNEDIFRMTVLDEALHDTMEPEVSNSRTAIF